MAAARLPACLLLFFAVIGSPGCNPSIESSPMTTAEQPVSEPTWSEQLAAVRQGRSRRIVVTQAPVTDAELSELANGCAALEVLDLDRVECGAERA